MYLFLHLQSLFKNNIAMNDRNLKWKAEIFKMIAEDQESSCPKPALHSAQLPGNKSGSNPDCELFP